MKILHTADIHLDSPLNGVADPSGRRLELLSAMANIAKYADNCGAAAVIVAGDLFDEKNDLEDSLIMKEKPSWSMSQTQEDS